MGDDKTIDEVYRDRNLLAFGFCVLAAAAGYDAGWYEAPDTDTDDADDEWIVVWAELPTGLVSWHVPRDVVLGLPGLGNEGVVYDGHDRAEKNARLGKFLQLYGGTLSSDQGM